MATSNALRDVGIRHISAAQGHEVSGDYRAALLEYKSGIDALLASAKYEQTEQAKNTLRRRVSEYMKRAEELDALIIDMQSSSQKRAVAAASVSKSSSAPAPNTDDELTRQVHETVVFSGKLDVHWDDIAGLHDAKEELKQAVVYPIKLPHIYANGRVSAWSGIMLYGPPGTGKTLLAKAVATEGGAKTFMNVSIASIMSKFVGDSERMVAAIFRVARSQAPTVIFIDEIDAMASRRSDGEHDVSRKVKNQLMQEMDGLATEKDKRVLVLAATNRPGELDEAIARRLTRHIYIPLPSAEARRQIFEKALRDLGDAHQSLAPDDVTALVDRTDGWSGSDIAVLISAARNHQMLLLSKAHHFLMHADGETRRLVPCEPGTPDAVECTLDELLANDMGGSVALPPVSRADFDHAFTKTRPIASPETIKTFEDYARMGLK